MAPTTMPEWQKVYTGYPSRWEAEHRGFKLEVFHYTSGYIFRVLRFGRYVVSESTSFATEEAAQQHATHWVDSYLGLGN